MLFSIITPSFRQLDWLGLCAASIADQEVNVEHLVQDAGSPGMEAWMKSHPEVQVKVEPDDGMYDAINRGLLRARGDVCAYLNSDEQYLPGVLRRVGDFFDQHPDVDVLFGDAIVTDASLKPLAYRRVVVPSRLHTLLRPLGVLTCSTFFRRKLVDDGVLFDPSWKIIGDKAWILHVLNRNYRMAVLHEPLALFAFTGVNLSQSHRDSSAERRRWEQNFSAGFRLLQPFVRFHHGWRKWRADAYRTFTDDLHYYQWDTPSHRTTFTHLSLGSSWPDPKIASISHLSSVSPASESPASYQERFLAPDEAESYATREYGAGSYASAIWALQQPLLRRGLLEARQRYPTGRHLDFACGTGRITRLAEEIFPSVDAVDISASMVELARKICSQARFFVGNILENPGICPGPYTSITSFRLLLNLDPTLRIALLKQLHDRLHPEGVLIVNMHGNLHSLRQPAIIWKRWRHSKSLPRELMLNTMSRDETVACLHAAGFQVERLRGTGILPPTLYRWPLRFLWAGLDRWLSRITLLQLFCIDLIFICRKKEILPQ